MSTGKKISSNKLKPREATLRGKSPNLR